MRVWPDGILAYMGAIDSMPTARDADIETAQNYVKNALAQINANNPAATSSSA